MKVSELTGIALDWAVAKADGHDMEHFQVIDAYQPSTNWAQGGEIIERERISVISDFHEIRDSWMAENYDGDNQEYGPTPLIAAMRVYVARKLGDDIEIPEELL